MAEYINCKTSFYAFFHIDSFFVISGTRKAPVPTERSFFLNILVSTYIMILSIIDRLSFIFIECIFIEVFVVECFDIDIEVF